MRYLIINHVPLVPGPTDWRCGDLWREDLRAQVHALNAVGFKVELASPAQPPDQQHDGSGFHLVPVIPEKEGFTYHPLPYYRNLLELGCASRELFRRLNRAILEADVVQADYGGHPIALGQIAWPLARRAGKRRIWVFDGADPIPRMRRHAAASRGLGRWAKASYANQFERFCMQAVKEADLVFAHNEAVVQRFGSAWHEKCQVFQRSFVRTEDLLASDELNDRCPSTRPLRLVVCGRLTAIKAVDQVLMSIAQVLRAGTAVELLILGEGEEETALRALTRRLGLDHSVRFAAAVPYGAPLFAALSDCDVMVVTNLTSEISRNIFLAMSRGLPLICYHNPATDHMLTKVGAARLVKAGDIAALCAAIQELEADRPVLRQMASRGLLAAAANTLPACHQQRAEQAANLFRNPLRH